MALGQGPTIAALSYRLPITICHSLALITTTFRLVHRRQRKQCSWDDFWALVAVACDTVVFVYFWIRVMNNDRTSAGHPPSRTMGRINNLTDSLAFTSTVWSARISIACSVLRILPRGRIRSFVFYMTCLFGLTAALMLFFKSWICGRDLSWNIDCPRGRSFNIAKLATDIVADVALITVPLYLLWHTSLPKAPRYMLASVFATSILTTALSAVHAVYGMGTNTFLDGVTAHVEAAVTVMVCNLLVIVTYIYRRARNGRDLDDDITDFLTTQAPRRRAPLTFMSFTNIAQSKLTNFFSTTRRGSSIFLEATSSSNAGPNHHPTFGSDFSSVDSRGSSSVKPAKNDTTSSTAVVSGIGMSPPLPDAER
ncbi:hypothetical protein FPV67DRAFT_1511586 [Lyophyllum atratum]|nr:hypothetical protein FPV67DRAFT_1511586 [Lyophyllum atratum]